VGKNREITEEVTMAPSTLFERIRSMDVRILASIGAALLLIAGVMWTVPFTPDSNSFTIESARRDMVNARPIEFEQTVEGSLVDGSDVDFYRINPVSSSIRIDVHMSNGSPKLIPALRVFDSTRNVVVDRSKEFVRQPGASVDCTFLAQSNMPYFIRIAGQRNTTGSYRLTVSRQP
jgi:hypothetical protein